MTVSPLELALSYAKQGFTILPVNPATKAALTKNWTNKPDKGEFGSRKMSSRSPPGGRNGRTLRRAAHRQDQRHRLSSISTGTACATASRQSGHSTASIRRQTATVLSAGGGQHLYYAYAGELKSTTLGEGVDFLAEGRR